MCRASSVGTVVYSWERSSGSSWTTVSNDNTTSYTTDTTLAIGQYMYRCRVSNDAGSVVSNNAIVNVYGMQWYEVFQQYETCTNIKCMEGLTFNVYKVTCELFKIT